MKKSVKIWLIVASALTIAGILLFGGMMAVLNWDFTKLSTIKYEEKTITPGEDFQNITIETNTEDILILPSEDDQCRVVCYDASKLYHSVSIENHTLKISQEDERKWYDRIGIFSFTKTITLYLPREQYGCLAIENTTGDVKLSEHFTFESIGISQTTGNVENYASASGSIKMNTSTGNILANSISAETLELTVTTGKITVSDVNIQGDIRVSVSTGKAALTNVTCKNLTSSGDTGDLSLKNVIAGEAFSLERSTGDISMEQCDAPELTIKTDTGSVTGSLLTEKVFIAQSDTGRIDVPKSKTGGICEITTSTGSIKITITK